MLHYASIVWGVSICFHAPATKILYIMGTAVHDKHTRGFNVDPTRPSILPHHTCADCDTGMLINNVTID